MTNLDKYKDNYQRFPQLPEMKKLCHFSYWDGAYSGLCLINGERYYFDFLEEFDSYPEDEEEREVFEAPWYRRFLVWKLTGEQMAEVDRRHEKFRRLVGTHSDYDENGKRKRILGPDPNVTGETTAQYFREAKLEKPLDLTPNDDQILGWYEWS